MKKRVFGRKFSRDRGARAALFRSIIKALALHGQIKTTYARAKAIQPEVERLISLAKKGGLAARRRILSALANDRKVSEIFVRIATAFSGKSSGFTRIIRLPARRGDKSEVVRLEWSQKILTDDDKKRKIN